MMEFSSRNSVSAMMACIRMFLEWGYTYTGFWQITAEREREREKGKEGERGRGERERERGGEGERERERALNITAMSTTRVFLQLR